MVRINRTELITEVIMLNQTVMTSWQHIIVDNNINQPWVQTKNVENKNPKKQKSAIENSADGIYANCCDFVFCFGWFVCFRHWT